MVIIGADLHKRTHTLVAIDEQGRRLEERTRRRRHCHAQPNEPTRGSEQRGDADGAKSPVIRAAPSTDGCRIANRHHRAARSADARVTVVGR